MRGSEGLFEGIEAKDLLGVYADIAEIIGVEQTYLVFKKLHGQTYLFPQHFYNPKYVTEIVQKEHISSSCKELARKYNYSERRIRQMIKNEDK